jgi:16S rRNA U1498 N3-methylase RsmE
MESGAMPISLGKSTLRAETAAIVGVSILAYIGGVL